MGSPYSLLPTSAFLENDKNPANSYPKDAWSRRSFFGRLFLFLLLPLCLGAIHSIFPGFGSTMILLLASVIVLIMATIGAFIILADLFRLRWAKALQRAVIIISTLAVFIPAIQAGDHIHLLLFYPYYKAEIRKSGKLNQQVPFDWGDAAAWVTDGAIIRTLVYDPTGSIQEYVGRRRASDMGSLYTDHLFGDFYLETDMSLD